MKPLHFDWNDQYHWVDIWSDMTTERLAEVPGLASVLSSKGSRHSFFFDPRYSHAEIEEAVRRLPNDMCACVYQENVPWVELNVFQQEQARQLFPSNQQLFPRAYYTYTVQNERVIAQKVNLK